MKKLSYYTIFTDDLNEHQESVVFSTRSGEAILISKKMRDLLTNGQFDEIPDNVLQDLLSKKVIVNEHDLEIIEIVEENKQVISNNDFLYEVIQPTAYCQLGCDYCGQDHTKNNISENLQLSLISRIKKKLSLKEWRQLSIGWFGGEPLVGLPQMRSITKELKQICKEYGIPYSGKVVTNGLSLKKNIFLELANELNITSIEITLDGVAEFHDKVRHTKSGNATFDIIVKNLLEITSMPEFDDSGCSISIRCNVDHRNWEGVSPLIKYLADIGLHKKISYFYPIGIYSWGGNEAHQKSLTKEKFAELEIDWLIEMLELGYAPNLLPGRVREVCIAVSETSEMYDAFGNIFNCTEVSYTDFYKDTPYTLGNLKFGLPVIQKNKPLSDWNDVIVSDKSLPCNTCKMLPVCGGACPKSWHEDMRACPSNKFNIKDKLALAYVLTQTKEGEELLKRGKEFSPIVNNC